MGFSLRKGRIKGERRRYMNLKKLISNLKIEKISGNPDLEIEGLACDSRKVRKNFLFVAIRGFKQDGHQFIPKAIKRGAKAIIAERDTPIPSPDVVSIKVPSSRLALAKVSNCFYGFPSQKMKVIGITGTNGKTTTVYMLESILNAANFKVGKISTIDYNLGEELYSSHPSFITTPEPEELQRMLRIMVDKKVKYVVIEVSSHSLVLRRVEGIEFDWVIFTNLSPEHLDFHKTMNNYLQAKASLFKKSESDCGEKIGRKAVINVDEEAGSYILKNTPYQTITYGIKEKALFQAEVVKTEIERTSFILKIKGEEKEKIDLSLPGLHNVYNALAAVAVSFGENISLSLIKRGLENLKRVPGRLEPVENRRDLKIFVDYAHTQDGLEKVLRTLRKITKKRLLLVFGCGGDRDKLKRPLMGKVAFKLADYSVITSDNPRSEDPEDIITQIEKGAKDEGGRKIKDYLTISNRREAIKKALQIIEKGDVLLIAGKGHEKVQIFKDKVVEFDDREVAQDLLKEI